MGRAPRYPRLVRPRRNPLSRALDRLSATWNRLLRGYRPRALLFHRIVGEEGEATWGPSCTRDVFAAFLDYLIENGFQGVTLSDLQHAVEQDEGFAERYVGLSFDDGTADFYGAAWPLLAERGLGATVFMTTSLMGGQGPPPPWRGAAPPVAGMTSDQIRELDARGIEIGSHGVHHYALPHLSDDALERELADSRCALEKVLGHEVAAFSYPHGAFDERVLAAVAAAGYRCAWACTCAPIRRGADRFALPRVPVPEAATRRSDFEALMYDGDLVRRVRERVFGGGPAAGADVPLPPVSLRRPDLKDAPEGDAP